MEAYEPVQCRVCGGELDRIGDSRYKCRYCNAEFTNAEVKEYEGELRAFVRDGVSEAFEKKRRQDIANARRSLYKAVWAENVSSKEVVRWCQKIKEYQPEDIQAEAFEILNEGTNQEINQYLDSIDVKGNARYYLGDIVEFMLKSLENANLLSLKGFVERAFSGREKTEYISRIEEEGVKYNNGIYNPYKSRDAFIAYSSKDMKAVNAIVNEIEKAGLECFVASRNLRHGRKSKEDYRNLLEAAMRNCTSFVFMSSHNSRKFDCDAIEKELYYVKDNDIKAKRIEYILEDYDVNDNGIRREFKDFFGREQRRTPEDLIESIAQAKVDAKREVKYCAACGTENPMGVKYCGECGETVFVKTYAEYITQKEQTLKELAKKLAEEWEHRANGTESSAASVSEKGAASDVVGEARQTDSRSASAGCVGYSTLENYDRTEFRIFGTRLIKYIGSKANACIPDGITDIWDNAFNGCTSLKSIAIPDSVTYIGSNAFDGCTSLKGIILPKSVTEIGEFLFYGCASLKRIVVEKGNSVFHSAGNCLIETESKTLVAGCKNSVIPNDGSVTEIDASAFNGCVSLQSITIPQSVTEIGEGAFDDCISLERIVVEKGNGVYHSAGNCLIETESKTLITGCKNSVIPNDGSVTEIGDNAFNGCTSLKSIAIPDSVTYIGSNAFDGCTSLKGIILPKSVTEIGEFLFYGCASLKRIVVEKGNSVFHSAGNCLIETESKTLVAGCKNSVIPNDGSVTEIGDNAFNGCTSLKSIAIPDSVTYIGSNAFDGCTSLKGIILPKSVTEIGEFLFYGCASLERIVVEKGNSVFHSAGNCLIETESKTLVAGCKNSVIPNDGSVTEIDASAFNGCVSLKSIIIPDSITRIGGYAFRGCISIECIDIPDSVTCIGDYAFARCTSLKSITIPDSITEFGEAAFYHCTSIRSVTISEGVTCIGYSAFAHCTSLETIIIPDSVIEIGAYAFYRTQYYEQGKNWDNGSLYIGNCLISTGKEISGIYEIRSGTTIIGDLAFEGCTSLKSITIPDSVTNIGIAAFKGCTSLKSITIPDSVTNIGMAAFEGCTSLKSITIPDSVTNIGIAAFKGCTSLKSITIPDSVTNIGMAAFEGCTSLESITIPDSVTSIGKRVFKGCISLESIIISNGVTEIGDHAFYSCDMLTIYCRVEKSAKPSSWGKSWNCGCNVVWGYKGD